MVHPGEVNWMIAGSGIAHSERTPQEIRDGGGELFGIQSWVALPTRDEEIDPSFAHHGADELPVMEGEGKSVRLICGSIYNLRAPVRTLSEMFYADVTITRGASMRLPTEHEERAAYVVGGVVEVVHERFTSGQLLVFKPGEEVVIHALEESRIMLLGGAPLDGKRHIWWNFVSSSPDRIEQAKDDWKSGRFAPVPGETEYIPIPELGPVVVRYP